MTGLPAHAARLRELRRARGLTLEALAGAAGLHLVTVADIERGAQEPGLAVALALARVLDVRLEELLGGAADRRRLPKAVAAEIAAGAHPVRALRQHVGVTQTHLAGLAGLSQSHVAQVEAGKRGLTAPALARLAAALGVSAEALARAMRSS